MVELSRNYWYKKRCVSAFVSTVLMVFNLSLLTVAQEKTLQKEDDYYKMYTVSVPEHVILEIGGMATLPDGGLAVCTRRGEVWKISNPYATGGDRSTFNLFASGLHEPLGLAYHDNDIYVTQRGELTRLRDTDKDGQADQYDKIYSWPLSGNYHEYSYGPLILPDGNMLVTLNLGWSNSLGHGVSLVPWRGWMLQINKDDTMLPFAAGLRSPSGYVMNAEGDVFYSENQGDWVGSGRITHLEKGDFAGNAESLRWIDLPGSTVKLNADEIPRGVTLYDAALKEEGIKPPAVWLPHGILGISTSGLLIDNTGGKFGPFANQMFVGDQGQSKIMRVDLEKVNGVYQGVVFPFREGFSSGVLRMSWGHDGSQFVGMTSRGWSSTGRMQYSLQRLVWSGIVPFEMQTVRAMPDGFEIVFTKPVDKKTAETLQHYKITGFNYKYQPAYGSPVINEQECIVKAAIVSEDGLKVRLVADGLRPGYIHEISLENVLDTAGISLLHNTGYYTLNSFPQGERIKLPETVQHAGHATHSQKAPPKPTASEDASSKKQQTSSAVSKRRTTKPASWEKPDVTINMGTKPGLKFNPEKFEVKAGSKVKIVFANNDDMLHNLVVVKPGTAIEVGELGMKLGLKGQEKNYIADTPKILFYTNLLQPHQSESIYFTAPTTPGDYTYVCTVPGHFYIMQGIMRVVK